jgi:acetylornithine/succinyldiaminopimelate/putrescine aminotransferase/acyl-CoA synthetase (AMP-forming)/AMP-acid ligase II/predicted amino acid dehydrogenase/acyl carrier protein
MPRSSFVEILRTRAVEFPHRLSYGFLAAGEETESLTFSQLDLRARAIGARLQQLGAKGERALLLYPPGTDYILAFYGCLAGGAVAVPAYPPRMNRNLPRLLSILEDARPKVVLTNETIFRQMRRWFDEAPGLAGLEWIITADVRNEEEETWVDPQANADTLAFLQYTSASTSAPKGVMVSHGNLLHNEAVIKSALAQGPDTVIVSWLPLFHDLGLIGNVLAALYNGVPCHLMSPVDFLKKPRLWLEAMTRYKGTWSGGPDYGYQLCVEKIGPEEREGLDLSHWRVAFNGSEPIRAETLRNFTNAFAGCGFRSEAIFPCYGLAEHTLFATGRFQTSAPRSFSRSSLESHRPCQADTGQGIEVVSCGNAVLNTHLAIVDPETCRRCPEGEVCEIWLAGPSVGQGYWNRPQESESVFKARLADGEGPFLRTGDLGFLHGGELHVTGRLKDLIILRGRNLIPHDIEQTVESCDPAIRPAFVAAVSVEAGGTERLVVVAEVRREARKSLDTGGLITRIRNAVAAEHAVETSAVVLLRPNELPKTSSGKTQRAKVRQDFLAGQLGVLAEWRQEKVFGPAEKAAPAPAGWSAERLEDWLAERLAARLRLAPDLVDRKRPIAFCGLDSVVAVAFIGEIEEALGVNLPVDLLFEGEPNLRQVARQILGESGAPSAAPPPAGAEGESAEPETRVESTGSPRRLQMVRPAEAFSGRGPERPSSPHRWPVLANRPAGSNRPPEEHPFRTCVNPELGRLLAQMAMDKTFVQGEGCWLWDKEGRRYLDFLAQYGALPFGFNPPRIWAALNAVQASGEPSFVQPSYLDAAGELARRLLAVAPPGMAHVTFANSGAEAIEAAIKLCRSTTGRPDILAATNGFHGKTLGALSATDKQKYQKPFGAPVPGFDYVPYGDLQALRRALSSGRYAGFLVEPVQGEGGIVEPPAGYLRLAKKACREAGTLFVADEIQTGLGRTGVMFVCGAEGITPDVMTVAKALGGGLIPIGACLSTAEAYNQDFALKHTSTFAGNTLACRAGLATLDLLEEDGGALLDQVAENGGRLKESFLALQRRFPDLIGEVRGRGYLLGLRFGLDRYCVDDGLLGYIGEQEVLTALVVSHLLHCEGVRVGYTLNQGGVMRIEPPLTATWEESQFFLQALERVLLLLERRDLAALSAHITGFDPAAVANSRWPIPEPVPHSPRRRRRGPSGEGRFAFLVHPLTLRGYTDLDGSLAVLSDDQLQALSSAIADNFDPLVIGETRIVAENGKAAYGEFILIPRRAEELMAMAPRDAVEEIRAAVLLGQARGAKIVGLGAYTSVVTHGGLNLRTTGVPPLTTGNSFTVAAAHRTVRLAAAERAWELPRRTVAVVGAAGSIGQALSILLTQDAGRLILLGNPAHPEESRERLLQLAGRIVCSLSELRNGSPFPEASVAGCVAALGLEPAVRPDRAGLARLGGELIRRTDAVTVSVDSASLLPEADVVVCCTNTTERMVRADRLRPSAIVCDISRPSNVGAKVRDQRPDVMVVNGGVVRLPGNSSLGFNASLAAGCAYACMAETMMLALAQRYEDTSLGFELPLKQVFEMERLAAELGFRPVLDKRDCREREISADDTTVANTIDFGGARG